MKIQKVKTSRMWSTWHGHMGETGQLKELHEATRLLAKQLNKEVELDDLKHRYVTDKIIIVEFEIKWSEEVDSNYE